MTSNEPDLQERLSALDDYFARRGVNGKGFVGSELSERVFNWTDRRGLVVMELSYEKLMGHHPLELLDLADSALTEHKPSH